MYITVFVIRSVKNRRFMRDTDFIIREWFGMIVRKFYKVTRIIISKRQNSDDQEKRLKIEIHWFFLGRINFKNDINIDAHELKSFRGSIFRLQIDMSISLFDLDFVILSVPLKTLA